MDETPAEAVRAGLAAVGASLADGAYPVSFTVVDHAGASGATSPADPARPGPLVSCLMVTRSDVAQIAFAVRCYQAQTWPNRELVVVCPPGNVGAIEQQLRSMAVARFSVHGADQTLTLGDLRNLSIARARGDIMMQWDDDDLHDPLRIELSCQVLVQSGAAMSYLTRELIWWPARRLAAISRAYLKEHSLAVWRDHAPVYPALGRGEDSRACEQIFRTRKVAGFDAPLQYLYAIHDRNTWDAAHFEAQVAEADRVFAGDQFDALCELLSPRMPVADYVAYLTARAG